MLTESREWRRVIRIAKQKYRASLNYQSINWDGSSISRHKYVVAKTLENLEQDEGKREL